MGTYVGFCIFYVFVQPVVKDVWQNAKVAKKVQKLQKNAKIAKKCKSCKKCTNTHKTCKIHFNGINPIIKN